MLNIMIKPVSGACNMRCSYCFYVDEMKFRAQKNLGVMTENTLSLLLDKVFACEGQTVSFTFQGGEPMLAGIEYYRTFIEKIKVKNIDNIEVFLSVQTNGSILNEEWAKFFSENNFLVGLSLDGIKDTHDFFRKDLSGNGTFERVIKAAQLLKRFNCEFNILTVVTKAVAQNIEPIYQFYRQNNFIYQQYIPCMDGLSEERGKKPYSLTPDDYELFLKKLFDLYKKDMLGGRYVQIRRFDNWCAMIGGREPEECGLRGCCTPQLLVEADGSVYPCDFYALDEFYMGNIREQTIWQLFCSAAAKSFFAPLPLSKECQNCEWLPLCRGGCPRDRMGGPYGSENYYCKALHSFFAYACRDMVEIFKKWNSFMY